MILFVSAHAHQNGYRVPWRFGFVYHDITMHGDFYALRPFNLLLRFGDRLASTLLHWALKPENLRNVSNGVPLTTANVAHWHHRLAFDIAQSFASFQHRTLWHTTDRPPVPWLVLTHDDLRAMLSKEAAEFAEAEYWRGMAKHSDQIHEKLERARKAGFADGMLQGANWGLGEKIDETWKRMEARATEGEGPFTEIVAGYVLASDGSDD